MSYESFPCHRNKTKEKRKETPESFRLSFLLKQNHSRLNARNEKAGNMMGKQKKLLKKEILIATTSPCHKIVVKLSLRVLLVYIYEFAYIDGDKIDMKE